MGFVEQSDYNFLWGGAVPFSSRISTNKVSALTCHSPLVLKSD
jgi:hypothetical protein